jgi:hypothetical protein
MELFTKMMQADTEEKALEVESMINLEIIYYY